MCPSRKNMFSVMSNTGFSCLIIKKSDYIFTIPPQFITKGGAIHKRVSKLIQGNQISELKKIGVAVQ